MTKPKGPGEVKMSKQESGVLGARKRIELKRRRAAGEDIPVMTRKRRPKPAVTSEASNDHETSTSSSAGAASTSSSAEATSGDTLPRQTFARKTYTGSDGEAARRYMESLYSGEEVVLPPIVQAARHLAP